MAKRKSKVVTVKQLEQGTPWRLCEILIFSVAIALTGACRVHEGQSEASISVDKNGKSMESAQTVERKWAQHLDLPGLPNLYKVSDDLYRGAQPTGEGFRQLDKLGIKTDVNLRFIHSDKGLIKGTALDYEHINVTSFWPKTSDVVRFLKIVTDKKRTPVFVHCHKGIDRAGMMCAAYRVVVQGWSKDEAIEEMTKGGFASRRPYGSVVNFVRKLDVDRVKQLAGLKE
jgi:protein tyrosine phosphatase (PTP) superfamily phosphohydrolase (DUF442 family)